MTSFIICALLVVAIVVYLYWRLSRSNLDPVTIENAERRLGPKAALQFALDNGLPLKTSEGETDGFNVWNARNVSGLRVPDDLSGRKPHQHLLDEQAARLKKWRETH